MRRFAACLLAAVMLFTVLPMQALASGETISCTYVPITGDIFVVDSINGVEARYNSHKKLYCVELVQRYFKELYGISVSTGTGGPRSYNKNYWFEETTNPKPGDVAYGSTAARGVGYAHWAMVKSYDGNGVVTLVEQNWKWNGKAGYERKIACPGIYRFFTLRSSIPGAVESVNAVKETATAADSSLPSGWAVEYVDKAAEYGISFSGEYQSSITKKEFCQLAIQVLEANGNSMLAVYDQPEFEDTDDEFVIAAYQMGFVKGTSDSLFEPDKKVSREMAAVIIQRMADRIGIATTGSDLSVFSDVGSVSPWARGSLSVMYGSGIFEGSDNLICPAEDITCEAVMAMFVRLLNLYEAQSGTRQATSVAAHCDDPAALRLATSVN